MVMLNVWHIDLLFKVKVNAFHLPNLYLYLVFLLTTYLQYLL